jgi:hypothetical protein
MYRCVHLNKVQRVTFGPKEGEVTGGCSKLKNEEYNNLHCWPNIVMVVKWRSMIWAGNVERTTKWEMCTQLLSENIQGNDYVVVA